MRKVHQSVIHCDFAVQTEFSKKIDGVTLDLHRVVS